MLLEEPASIRAVCFVRDLKLPDGKLRKIARCAIVLGLDGDMLRVVDQHQGDRLGYSWRDPNQGYLALGPIQDGEAICDLV